VDALNGSDVKASIDDQVISNGQYYNIKAGQVLKRGKVEGAGERAYLAVSGGLSCPD